jgi:hypothetical protein
MVSVGLIGAGLVPDDVISVAPRGIPVPPTEVPLVTSSGEVVPMDGVGTTIPCATAMWPAKSKGRATVISKSLIGAFHELLRRELIDHPSLPVRSGPDDVREIAAVLRTTTLRKGCSFEGLISMCGT